jgi:hypothetical protein
MVEHPPKRGHKPDAVIFLHHEATMNIVETISYLVVAILAFNGCVRFGKALGMPITVGDLIGIVFLSLFPFVNLFVMFITWACLGILSATSSHWFDWTRKRVF